MRKLSLAFILAVSCVLLAACSPKNEPSAEKDASSASSANDSIHDEETGQAYHKITAEEAKKMLDDGNATVVDVRTAEEYEAEHISDALLVPLDSIGEEPPEALPDKDAVLLIHCRTGVRSKQASDKLVALGYTQIYDFGGIVDWPYETITAADANR